MPQQAGKAAALESVRVLSALQATGESQPVPPVLRLELNWALLGSTGQQSSNGEPEMSSILPSIPHHGQTVSHTHLHAQPAPASSENLSRWMGAFLDPTLRALFSQGSLSPRGLVWVPSPVGAGLRAALSPRLPM